MAQKCRFSQGTLDHAGAIVHVIVSPVDPKTGQRRASAGFAAFAENGPLSPWEEDEEKTAGSSSSSSSSGHRRRPGVALVSGGTNSFPILPSEEAVTVRVLVDRWEIQERSVFGAIFW